MNIAGLVLSEVDGSIFLRALHIAERQPELASELPRLISESEFAECHIEEEVLQQAIRDYQLKPDPFVLPIGQRCDAQINVQVAEDGMRALLNLAPAKGGKPVAIEDVLKALSVAGVNFGIDEQAMLQACAAGVAEDLPVALGLQPEDGQDSDFVELVTEMVSRTPKEDENGLIDYREHNAIGLVEPGAALMRRIPPVPGKPGRTVFGQPLEPRPVRDEPFNSQLVGSAISPDDPNLLTATIAGMPVRIDAGVLVEPVLHLEQVNLESGNVYFDGTVNVVGDVHQSMKLEASGDIFVGGTVDGGRVKAGGNIRVRGGVIAGSQVFAGGALTARFAEASQLHSGTVLTLEDAVLDCALESLNQILVGTRAGDRGRLAGGSVKAKMLLRVPRLGNEQAALTRIEMAVDPELDRKWRELEARMAQEKTNEDNLQKVVAHLIAIKDPKGMLERARAAWRAATQAWGRSLVERSELERQRALLLLARVEVQAQTDGAVELVFGGRRLILRNRYQRGMFSMNREGRIVFTGPDGQSYPAG